MMKTVCSQCQVATSTVTLRFVAPRLKDRISAGKVPRAPEQQKPPDRAFKQVDLGGHHESMEPESSRRLRNLKKPILWKHLEAKSRWQPTEYSKMTPPDHPLLRCLALTVWMRSADASARGKAQTIQPKWPGMAGRKKASCELLSSSITLNSSWW